MKSEEQRFIAFAGHHQIESGTIEQVAAQAKQYIDDGDTERIAIYNDLTGVIIDLDFRGTVDDVVKRLSDHPMLPREETAEETPRGRGRPKLGVVPREVTLLPRHWEWLGKQRGGSSAAIRRLVDAERKRGRKSEERKEVIEAVHRFIWDIASNFDNFEEVSRALFAGETIKVTDLISGWPPDVQRQVSRMLSRIKTPGQSE